MPWGNIVFPLLIITSGGGFTGLFVYSPGPGAGKLIASVAARSGTDPFGNSYLPDFATYGSTLATSLESGGLGWFSGSLAGGWPTGIGQIVQSSPAVPVTGIDLAGQVVTLADLESWLQPTGDATGVKDSANISALLLAGKSLHLLPGTFNINAAITLATNSSLIGAGAGTTIINQVTSGAEGITGTNVSTVTLRGFTLVGNGSGVSTKAGIHFSSNPATANIILDDIIVQNFGLQGFLFDSVFLTELRKCEALANGGSGFQVTNSFASPTSFSFHACYANANLGTYGYELDALQYSSLSGCAADSNATGYGLLGCQGVILTGCGTEAFTATGYLMNNCKGCGLYGGFTFNGKTKVAWMTNGSNRCTVGGLTETSPAAGATACVQTDAGTSFISLWGITHVTADSLAAGTFTNVDGSA
jgi:hypothetical protein